MPRREVIGEIVDAVLFHLAGGLLAVWRLLTRR